MSETKPPDPDAEREVDLRSAWTRITARWWLPVAGLVIGAILGVLVSVGGGEVFRATDAPLPRPAVHDLGRRTDPEPRDEPEDGEPDHPLARRRCARPPAASGLTVGQLRGRVSSEAVVSAGQGKNVSPLVEITVDAAAAAQGREGGELARECGHRHRLDLRRPEDRAAQQADRLEQDRARGHRRARLDRRQATAGGDQGQDDLVDRQADRDQHLNNTISFSEQRRGTVQQELFQNQQLLSLAENVEKSKIVQPAVASKTTATSRRNAALIGALIGLLLGALAAAVADPFLQRRAARSNA